MSRIMIIVLSLMLVGCGSGARMLKVKEGGFAPRPKDHPIEIFNRSKNVGNCTEIPSDKIFGKFFDGDRSIPKNIVIGEIFSSGALLNRWEWVIEQGMKLAREQGGDAIIVRKYGAFCPTKPSDNRGRKMQGDLIRFNNTSDNIK